MSTNVKPSELNYDAYSDVQYDRDIVNSIPYHEHVHQMIRAYVSKHLDIRYSYRILDLGVGTGITSKLILDLLPQSQLDAVDFSQRMLEGAKRKLISYHVRYIANDYSEMLFDRTYNLILSVIGMHHQTHEGKRQMFQKIHSLLEPGGLFIFSDLMTYRDPKLALDADTRHYQHLNTHAADEATRKEWEHHHRVLNNMAPIEDQIAWLQQAGFTVEKAFHEMNTVLLFCVKS